MIGRHRLDLLVEGFNLLNRVNVMNVNSVFGPGTAPQPSFGRVTAVADMRQLQLGIRWSF